MQPQSPTLSTTQQHTRWRWSVPLLLVATAVCTVAATLILVGAFHVDKVHSGRPLRVLAFGDSLTEGYHDGGRRFHPYAGHLAELLLSVLPTGYTLTMHERGRSGERVVPSMQDRLSKTLEQAAMYGFQYDWVILLGGTNDIGTGSTASDVLEGLKAMYALARQSGAQVLAMTLPPFNVRLPDQMQAQYTLLNQQLRTWVADSGASQGVVLLDLEPLFPVEGIPAAEKAAMWDDNLHLTPAGYDEMAKHIFGVLQPHLERFLQGGSITQVIGAG